MKLSCLAWADCVLLLGTCTNAAAQTEPPSYRPPDDIAFRKATIISEGTRMAAEVFALKVNEGKALPTIIMCHGWGDNKGELLKQTYFLNENGGFNLFYFDFRSHGESEGEITTIGGLETIDFDAAYAWLLEAKPALAQNIGVFGLSMGAAVTVASLPKHPQIRCACVESPFSDYRTVIKRWGWNHMKVPYYPLVALTLAILRSRVKDPEIDRFNPVESAPKISPRPLFVIGGEFDRLMTPEDVTKVFNAAREPKQLWMVPDAWHAKCREAAGMEYDTRVIGFFKRNV